MQNIITVENHGPLIVRTNYYESDLCAAGKIYVSVNAGAIRILFPPSRWRDMTTLRQSKFCILSRGAWPEMKCDEAVEIMFEDYSDAPYALHLSPESFDMLPAKPDAGREWVVTVWTLKDGRLHKSLERKCYWRRVEKIPCMEKWKGGME